MSPAQTSDRPRIPSRRDGPAGTAERLVVAVDRRTDSARVLAAAAEEARRRGLRLRVVTAYADPDDPHAPKTLDQALVLHRRLRSELQRTKPWTHGAEYVVRRGAIQSLLERATERNDIVAGHLADDSA